MPLSREQLILQIEAAIESEHYTEAREILRRAEQQTGEPLDELARRIDEIEGLTRAAQARDLMARAQAEMAAANYEAAIDSLRRAAALNPNDNDISQFLARAERALERQQAAVERSRAVSGVSQDIEALLLRGDLSKARQVLHDAGVKFGRQPTLMALESRLEELEEEVRRDHIRRGLEQARVLFEAQDWRAALVTAGEVLRLNPANQVAKELQKQARVHLERQEGHKQRQEAVEAAQEDVERLIAARELGQAATRLREARESLGHDAAFDQLLQRIDRARSDLQFRQRIEWAERRAKEAERLIHEASSFSLQGEYATAIDRLEAARELDPSHPDLADLLAAADAALEKHLGRRRRSEALSVHERTVSLLLDQVRLEEAEQALVTAGKEMGEDEGLKHLRSRLDRMRNAERESRLLSSEGFRIITSKDLEDRDSLAALRQQQQLWKSYPWYQALLFPFRGLGLWAWGALVLVGLLLDWLVWLGGPSFIALLLPAAWLGFFPTIIRNTLRGRNQLAEIGELGDVRRWASDWGKVFVWVGGLLAPLLFWITLRPYHGLLEADGSFVEWSLVPLWCWFICAFGVMGLGVGELFGRRFMTQVRSHVQVLRGSSLDTHLAVALPFILLVLVVLARATLLPSVPWLGSFISRVIEAYGLLAVPHFVGVLARSKTLLFARAYGL